MLRRSKEKRIVAYYVGDCIQFVVLGWLVHKEIIAEYFSVRGASEEDCQEDNDWMRMRMTITGL